MAYQSFHQEYLQIPTITRAYTTSCVLTTLAVVMYCFCFKIFEYCLLLSFNLKENRGFSPVSFNSSYSNNNNHQLQQQLNHHHQ